MYYYIPFLFSLFLCPLPFLRVSFHFVCFCFSLSNLVFSPPSLFIRFSCSEKRGSFETARAMLRHAYSSCKLLLWSSGVDRRAEFSSSQPRHSQLQVADVLRSLRWIPVGTHPPGCKVRRSVHTPILMIFHASLIYEWNVSLLTLAEWYVVSVYVSVGCLWVSECVNLYSA